MDDEINSEEINEACRKQYTLHDKINARAALKKDNCKLTQKELFSMENMLDFMTLVTRNCLRKETNGQSNL